MTREEAKCCLGPKNKKSWREKLGLSSSLYLLLQEYERTSKQVVLQFQTFAISQGRGGTVSSGSRGLIPCLNFQLISLYVDAFQNL